MEKIIEKMSEEALEKMSMKIDRYLKLHLKPRPWWIPFKLWVIILRRLLVLDELRP